jgi:hypothetical protein
MWPFVDWERTPSSSEIVLSKWKSFKRRRKGSEQDRILAFVKELLADETVTSGLVADARRRGREAGFVEAVGIMGALLDGGERPTDMESAKMAMTSVADRISEFLPLRWQPISDLPDEGVFIGWNGGCEFFYVGHHHGERRCYSLDALTNGANFIRVHPTHFMPMPKEPGGAWDAALEEPSLSGCRWLVDALVPFSRIAGLMRRFADTTRIEEVQINPMLNLFVADFERAEKALDRLREIVGDPQAQVPNAR